MFSNQTPQEKKSCFWSIGKFIFNNNKTREFGPYGVPLCFSFSFLKSSLPQEDVRILNWMKGIKSSDLWNPHSLPNVGWEILSEQKHAPKGARENLIFRDSPPITKRDYRIVGMRILLIRDGFVSYIIVFKHTKKKGPILLHFFNFTCPLESIDLSNDQWWAIHFTWEGANLLQATN